MYMYIYIYIHIKNQYTYYMYISKEYFGVSCSSLTCESHVKTITCVYIKHVFDA